MELKNLTYLGMLLLTKSLDIIICHYPPYASKWNPIEHRLFAPAHRANRVVLVSLGEILHATNVADAIATKIKVLTFMLYLSIKFN